MIGLRIAGCAFPIRNPKSRIFQVMPKVVREDIDALNAVLTVTIDREAYEPEFKKELNKLKDRASVKGFRPGKVPTDFLKKMYGKELLGEIVSDLLQKELVGVMKEQEFRIIGQPIPAEGQPTVHFDYRNMQDYSFKFDVGVAPEFEVRGLDMNTTYDYHKVQVPADKVEERLEALRKSRGTQAASEAPIETMDMVQFSAVELDGDAPKADGWKTTFSVLHERLADGPAKEELLGKQKGHKLRFNVYELEQGTSREFVKKYLLNFTQADLDEGTETGEWYEGTIEGATRLQPAELDQAFFDQVFGEGKVASEEECRQQLAEHMAQAYTGQSDSLLFNDLHERLVDLNRDAMPLPADFLKRWLKVTQEKHADKMLENFEKLADDMRWSLIRNKLDRQFDIVVEEAEVEQAAYDQMASYFGGYYNPQILEPVVKRMLEDERSFNSLAAQVAGDKLFRKMKESVMLRDVPTSEEELKAKLDAVLAKNKQRDLDAAPTIGAADEEE
jgi:trigger factor